MHDIMLQRRSLLAVLTAAPLASPLSAFAQGSPTAPTLDVLATFTILADLARAIGGNQLRVASLVGPN